jgi:hypothetical protein
MSNKKRLWILGASDPEMVAIEQLLLDACETVRYAYCVNEGEKVRVHPGNMYRADGAMMADEPQQLLAAGWEIITIECDIPSQSVTRRIDHHREGDAGFGLPPADYFSGSSIGQVYALLSEDVDPYEDGPLGVYGSTPEDLQSGFSLHCGTAVYCHRPIVAGFPGDFGYGKELSGYFVMPDHILHVAAADHCLGAAYQGECPGVDVAEFIEFRLTQRAEFQYRPVDQIRASVAAATELILDKLLARGRFVSEPTPLSDPLPALDEPLDMTGSIIPELPEAACQLGVAVLAGPLDNPDGRKKIVLQSATHGQIKAFLAGELAPDLVDRYGDPARGFAGGYLPAPPEPEPEPEAWQRPMQQPSNPRYTCSACNDGFFRPCQVCGA